MKPCLVVPLSIVAIAAAALHMTYAQTARFVPVTDEMLRAPKAADWMEWRGNRGATGYSPLEQINRGNVRRLHMAWAWSMEPGSLEPEPLVYNGVMYLPHPGDIVQALDAVTGKPIWEYRRDQPKDARGGLGGNRNLAIYQDKVVKGALGGSAERSGRGISDHLRGGRKTVRRRFIGRRVGRSASPVAALPGAESVAREQRADGVRAGLTLGITGPQRHSAAEPQPRTWLARARRRASGPPLLVEQTHSCQTNKFSRVCSTESVANDNAL